MGKHYYKGKQRNYKLLFKALSFLTITLGALVFMYTFFPLISWQIYFAPAFASQKIQAPIPNYTLLNPSSIGGLISSATTSLNTDYTNAYNWYPGIKDIGQNIGTYTISIPKIEINEAVVTNEDSDLSKHLVQFNADTLPPKEGNTVIFGHSTLPQLYDPNNYKTIFANAYKLTTNDQIIVHINNAKYTYKIENITVVDATDTSVLAQNFSDSFITIITCTPPGTVWKRLIIKARIQKI